MEKEEYEIGFRKGLSESRFADDIDKIPAPEVDYTNYMSIGYMDGIEYGRYLVMVGMKYAIKEENLIAVMDKGYMRACDIVEENKIKKHI